MAFDPSNKDDVTRWAAGVTISAQKPVQDNDDVSAKFATYEKSVYYASVANQSTSMYIEKYTNFQWVCCLKPEELKGITKGSAYVAAFGAHIVPNHDAVHAADKSSAAVLEGWFKS